MPPDDCHRVPLPAGGQLFVYRSASRASFWVLHTPSLRNTGLLTDAARRTYADAEDMLIVRAAAAEQVGDDDDDVLLVLLSSLVGFESGQLPNNASLVYKRPEAAQPPPMLPPPPAEPLALPPAPPARQQPAGRALGSQQVARTTALRGASVLLSTGPVTDLAVS